MFIAIRNPSGAMKSILVASGTANTGSKVAEILSASGSVKVRALARNPQSDAARALAALPNVTVVQGDFTDAPSLKAALAGMDRALLVSAAGEDTQYDNEVAFIAAADEAGLEATVRISTANALISLESKGVYARAHARIEKYIAEHKSKVIDVRPNWYMSNWLSSAGEAKATGKITYPVRQDDPHKFAMVHPADVAGAAAAILLQPKDKLDQFLALGAVEVHGPEPVSFGDKLAAISKACGKELSINYIEPDAWVQMLVSFGMTEYFARSFMHTVMICSGNEPPARPHTDKSTPLLLEIWQPKYTIADWAKENASLFA